MAHKIEEFDKGYIAADSTWHGLPQFVCLGEGNYPTLDQAREVLSYPVVKEPLYRLDNNIANAMVPGAYCIVRQDTDTVLVPHVGERFTATTPLRMLESVERWLIPEFPDLVIDSVLTLRNGATALISLKLDTISIRGDESPTNYHVMCVDPMGEGKHKVCAHLTRVVCDNTKGMALKEGRANGSLQQFRHTAGAAQMVSMAMVEIAEAHMGLKKLTETLEELASVEVNTQYVDSFLEAMFGESTPEMSNRKVTNIMKKNDEVLSLFESGQHMTGRTRHSKYALFNAFTDAIDHGMYGGRDEHAMLDGLLGDRAKQKDKALRFLQDNVTLAM